MITQRRLFHPVSDALFPGKVPTGEEKKKIEEIAKTIFETIQKHNDLPLFRLTIADPATHRPITILNSPQSITVIHPAASEKAGSNKVMRVGSRTLKKEEGLHRVAVLFIQDLGPRFQMEIDNLRNFRDIAPRLFEHYLIAKDPQKKEGVILEELCEDFNIPSEEERQNATPFFAYQILQLAKKLHEKGFVYRDFKIDNLLLKKGRVKLVDVESICPSGAPKDALEAFGTWAYCSPESAKKMYKEEVTTNQPPADVWAIGVIIAQLLHSKDLICTYLKLDLSDEKIGPHIASLKEPFPSDLLTFPMEKWAAELLHPNPAQRPTVQQALQHPLFIQSLSGSPLFFQALCKEFLPMDEIQRDVLGIDLEQAERELNEQKENLLKNSFSV